MPRGPIPWAQLAEDRYAKAKLVEHQIAIAEPRRQVNAEKAKMKTCCSGAGSIDKWLDASRGLTTKGRRTTSAATQFLNLLASQCESARQYSAGHCICTLSSIAGARVSCRLSFAFRCSDMVVPR